MNASRSKQIQEQSNVEVVRQSPDSVLLKIFGHWKVGDGAARWEHLGLSDGPNNYKKITICNKHVQSWDSSLLVFIYDAIEFGGEHNIEIDLSELPREIQALIGITCHRSKEEQGASSPKRDSFVQKLGRKGATIYDEFYIALSFFGECFNAFVKLLLGRSKMRFKDVVVVIQQVGPDALFIVSLISVLVGLILALIGSAQLVKFGAQIYVANLVGVGMLREMGVIMCSVIVGGRTGAAFAAELGSMQANEEIDSLITLGLSPVEFLVLPRIIGLVLMLPLLCIYADILGILGGAIVSFVTLDISPYLYWEQTSQAIVLSDFLVGLFKSFVFALLIAFTGCFRGMNSGRSSSDVGVATTSAVVTSIILIVIFDAFFSVFFAILQV